MARTFKESIQGTTIPQARIEPQVVAPRAAPTSTFVAPAQDELSVLADSLRKLDPALQRAAAVDKAVTDDAGKKAGAALAAKEQDPRFVGDLEPGQPADLPIAARPAMLEAYRQGIAKRTGIEEADVTLDAYQRESMTEGFDAQAFFTKRRQEALAGVSDPAMVAEIGGHMDRAEAQVRSAIRAENQKKAVELRSSNMATALREVAPGEIHEVNQRRVLDAMKGFRAAGGSGAEAASLVLQHLVGQSAKAGGAPELFDIFTDAHDEATGKPLIELNPQLADAVAQAKVRAQHDLEKTLADRTLTTRQDSWLDLVSRRERGDFDFMSDAQVLEVLAPKQGKGGILNGEKDLVAFMGPVWERRAKAQHAVEVQRKLGAGLGHTLTEKEQKDAIKLALGDASDALLQGGDAATAAISRILQAHSATGVSVADEGLKQLVNSIKNTLPEQNATAVPQRFATVAALYASLKKQSPALVSQYFDKDSQDLFDDYVRETRDGSIPSVGAYKNAFRGIDPEARRLATEYMKNPAAQAAAAKTVTKAVDGWRRWVPFTGLDDSAKGMLGVAAEAEARRFIQRNPWGVNDLEDHLKSWAERNFYVDPKTRAAIELPPAMNGQDTREALSAWVGDLRKAYKERGLDITPRLHHKGDGTYALSLAPSGGVAMPAGDVSLADIRSVHLAKSNLTPNEMSALSTLRGKAMTMKATQADVDAASDALAKAERLGLWTGEAKARTDAIRATTIRSSIETNLGKEINKAASPHPTLVARRVEAPAARVANRMLTSGDYTGAMVAANEGLRLKTYEDSGGKTIGFGYHFNAHAPETIKDDFRRAGIPPEQWEAVRDGKLAITEEQATRLLSAVLPRYEADAKRVVEKREPGAWAKLTPQQKAVLTDLAYQGGAGNLAKLDEGLNALLKGDKSGEGLSLHIRKGGKLTPDDRRAEIRRVMLAGSIPFRTLISYAASQPANALERRTRQ